MNPFEKRATEYIRDDVAFLPYVTPEPLVTYLAQHAKKDVLFDRLIVLIGTPGSGKTTLARLFLLPTLTTLLRTRELPSRPSLIDALTSCKAVAASTPTIAGCRIPLESDYRDCWELPYSEDIRHNLFCSLLQARTVLAWLRGLEDAGYPLSDIRLVPRADAAAALEAIGGQSLEKIREVARNIERDVYQVSAGLMPPSQDMLPDGATRAYHPFDVIEAFEVSENSERLRIKPLVICDDAHFLHPKQLDSAIKWLARREIRVARWILTRVDALNPAEVLRSEGKIVREEPGINLGRDMEVIWMQSTGDRRSRRLAFRKIAKDMANRYLQQMPVFARRSLSSLEELLEGTTPSLPPSKLKQLQDSLTAGRRRLVGTTPRNDIDSMVDKYLAGKRRNSNNSDIADIRAMMIRILVERYLRRVPQDSLFDEPIDVVPALPLKADSDVFNAAEMLLQHEYGRPYYYGFESLCDAASENAEKFLRLAGHLVSQLETQIIRNGSQRLSSGTQDKLLKERATRMLSDEDMPERARVVRLCETIASQCLTATCEPNAPLSEGPNAWGIPQAEFDTISTNQPDLARVLQSGLSYNMFSFTHNYGTKGVKWCLIELSGVWSLRFGLSFARGLFLERKVDDLLNAIRPTAGGGDTP